MCKSWRDKYKTKTQPEVRLANFDFADVHTGEEVLVSTPAEIEAELRTLPKGTETTASELRRRLAAKHHVEVTCPITTGLFLRIIAEVALEDMAHGKPAEEVAPFWRAIPLTAPLAKKLSCGLDTLKALRRQEGLTV
ncbi:MAG: hypothetical protein WC498_02485 [Candidatus Saccharimonadales bacterium]